MAAVSVAGAGDAGLGVLAELGEEVMDAGDGGLVAFGFAGPPVFDGVLVSMSEVVRTADLRFAGVAQMSVDICLSVLVCTNVHFVLYSCARR